MLVFFIHGVNTKDASYADILIRKIKKSISYRNKPITSDFYSGYWGNLFNNKKQQTISCIEKDFSRACSIHEKDNLWKRGFYRYKNYRYQFINDFLGDFLVYQNPKRGAKIRETLLQQLKQFIHDHPNDREIHFVGHSLGTIILWDLLFSEELPENDPGYYLRKLLEGYRISSITTMGSPLLFLKQMMDFDFSIVNNYTQKLSPMNTKSSHIHKLRWVNIIHSSDMIAYPLKAAIEHEINSDLLFFDQYIWQYGNGKEKSLRIARQIDLAMLAGASDAHSSYLADNIDGSITARVISYNLLGETNKLWTRCVTPK